MSCEVCEREAVDCFDCTNKSGRERLEALCEREAYAKDQARRFLALLERNYQRWCDDGDSAGYRNRNGLIWDAIAKAGTEVHCFVNQGLDRGE